MKSIRSLFILIIGMMVLTVTAKTTAKLEQKQNVELTVGLIPQVTTLQVVKDFPAIQSEIAVVKSLEIQKSFYIASIDVGIYIQEAIFNTIYTTNFPLPNSSETIATNNKRRYVQGYNSIYKEKRNKSSC